MPGVNEQPEENQKISCDNNQNDSHQSDPNESSPDDNQPQRELTQTDRLNKILLNAFMDRINQQATSENTQNGNSQQHSANNDNEWDWLD